MFFASRIWLAHSGPQHRPFQISAVIPMSSFCISQPFYSPVPSVSSLLLFYLQPCCLPLLLLRFPRQPSLSSIRSGCPHTPSSCPSHLFPFTQVSSLLPSLSYSPACWLARLALLGALQGMGSVLFQITNGAAIPWWQDEFWVSGTALQKYSVTT